ncbi:MAG: DMT family transporter [Paraburkholderia sp.]|nr:MAG: DMT family transporter [Paraburkholderia sp.]
MRTAVLTLLAMIAFAANSLLCRFALRDTGIDAATFTLARIVTGALALTLIVRLRTGHIMRSGDWPSALALFAYAAGFSYAYVSLPASTGALLLFGAVQITMIGYGIKSGEPFGLRQWVGFTCALAGLVGLLLPGLAAPPLGGSVLMLGAGIAWGIYSLKGRGVVDSTAATAGNFLRASPFAVALSVAMAAHMTVSRIGLVYAALSGALTSGIGYALWYAALPALRAATAATVQLSVPVIAAAGAIAFLGEPLTPRIAAASLAILGGIAIVIANRRPAADAASVSRSHYPTSRGRRP